MANHFQTKKEAFDFVNEKMKNCSSVEPEVIFTLQLTLQDGIISQEHFSFFDYDLNQKYNAAILEYQHGFEVSITPKKYSLLVSAAEDGFLDIFKNEIEKGYNLEALNLSFRRAIESERLNILQHFYSTGLTQNLSLYQDPLTIASRNDRINSFQFLLRRGLKLPSDILGGIFHDNSKLIMSYIAEDPILSKEILLEKYLTPWANKGILKKNNETVRIFKALKSTVIN